MDLSDSSVIDNLLKLYDNSWNTLFKPLSIENTVLYGTNNDSLIKDIEDLKTMDTRNTEKIAAVDKSLQNSVSKMESSIQDTNTRIDTTISRIDSTNLKVNNTDSSVRNAYAIISGIDSSVLDLIENVNEMDSDIRDIIGVIDGSINIIESTLEEFYTDTMDALNDIESDIETIEDINNEYGRRLDNIDSDIESIKYTNDEYGRRLDNIETIQKKNVDDIEDISTSMIFTEILDNPDVMTTNNGDKLTFNDNWYVLKK